MNVIERHKKVLVLLISFMMLAAGTPLAWAESESAEPEAAKQPVIAEVQSDNSSDSVKEEAAHENKAAERTEENKADAIEQSEEVLTDLKEDAAEEAVPDKGKVTVSADTDGVKGSGTAALSTGKARAAAAGRQSLSTSLEIISPSSGTVVYKNLVVVKARLTDENGAAVQGQAVRIKATGNGYSRYSAEEYTDAKGEVSLEVRNLDVGTWSINVLHDADVNSDNTIVYGAADAYINVEIRPEGEDPANTAVAADEPAKIQILSLTQTGEGDRVKALLQVTDENGKVPANVTDYKYAFYTNTSKNYGWINDSDGTVETTRSISGTPAGTKYEIYAELWDENNKTLFKSESITITAIKPTFNKNEPVITTTESIEDQATGTITVEGNYDRIACYSESNTSKVIEVEGNVITGLAAGNYYVYSPYYRDGDTFYITSSKIKVNVGERPLERYNVTLDTDGHAYWWSENSKYTIRKIFEVREGDELEYTVRANDDYVSDWINGDVTWTPQENADVEIIKTDDTEWTVKITNIKGDITLNAKGEEKPILKYKVTAAGDENADWSKSEIELLPGTGTTLYVKPKNTDTHYISGVTAEPDGNAEITFNDSTGEVAVRNVTGDVVLTATSV